MYVHVGMLYVWIVQFCSSHRNFYSHFREISNYVLQFLSKRNGGPAMEFLLTRTIFKTSNSKLPLFDTWKVKSITFRLQHQQVLYTWFLAANHDKETVKERTLYPFTGVTPRRSPFVNCSQACQSKPFGGSRVPIRLFETISCQQVTRTSVLHLI